jgi:hypothetical protein
MKAGCGVDRDRDAAGISEQKIATRKSSDTLGLLLQRLLKMDTRSGLITNYWSHTLHHRMHTCMPNQSFRNRGEFS